MAVYKDKQRGTWYCIIRYTDEQGQPKTKCKRGFEFKREAISYENTFRNAQKHGSNERITFGKVFTQLLQERAPTLSKTTITEYERINNKYFAQYQDIYIDRINQAKIVQWATEIKNLDKSKAYRNFILTLFKSILEYANYLYNTN